MAILIYFFILLLVALPLGSFSRITLGLTISFSLIDTVVLSGSAIWIVKQLVDHKKIVSLQAKAFIVLIGIFILSLIVNIRQLSTIQLTTAMLYIIRFIAFGTLFFMVKNSSAVLKKKLKLLLIGGGSLLTLGGYVQYFLYPSLRNLIYFGWDEHYYRMFGTFFDPNFFGLFLVLFFLFLLSQLFGLHIQKKKLYFVFYFSLTSAVFIAVFLTYSRTALVALFFGLAVLFWNKNITKWIPVLVAVGILLSILAFFLTEKKAQGNSLFRTVSTDARLGSARNALTIFTDSPIFGIGFNAYRYAQYRHHFMMGSPVQEDHGASGADSSVLLVLATSGLLGFILYLFFLATHVKMLLVTRDKIGLATLVAIFVGSFFINGLFYPALLIWLWVVLGITESSEQA